MPEMNAEEQKAYDEALRRIEACRRTKGTELDLSGLGLTRVPAELGQLCPLTRLYLSRNQLTQVPAELCQLTALTELRLDENQLTAVPAEFGHLTALTVLWLHFNYLTAVPVELGQLIALTDLRLSYNRLTAVRAELGQLTALTMLFLHNNQLTAVPAELGQLTALTGLALSDNQLTAVPAELGRLSGIIYLHLSDNQLTAVPAELGRLTALRELWLQGNHLASLPVELKQLTSLQKLFLHDNPALQLSPSVLGPDQRTSPTGSVASPRAILDFYFTREAGLTRPLNEVKMILVGRGGAGKTSTVAALRGLPFHEGEESTPGIALCDWVMDGCQGEPVTAHVWDFAGQVITHSLHQFFFSVRTVYVVVLTGRENSEREDAEYWLRLIKAFGTDDAGQGPPVIVALNKWDLAGCRPRVDRGALKERYPFIREFVEVDSRTPRGIPELKAALCREVDGLAWVRDPFPLSWDRVRRALAGEEEEPAPTKTGLLEKARSLFSTPPVQPPKPKRPHISYAEYRELCTGKGVAEERLQDSLAEILHNLGAALNYRKDPRLREATVLQPEWLTNNVYKLMRHAEAQEGLLKYADLERVLADEPDAEMRGYLVRLMERFEIAYPHKPQDADPLDAARDRRPLDSARDDRLWLVPQALPDTQPDEAAALAGAAEATRLRYTYPALPEGLVARAIVRLHEFIEEAEGHRRQWASGAILTREGARALLRKEPQDRLVTVTVTGPEQARQALAGLCQAELRDIHSDIPGLDPLEEMQVQGEWVKVGALEEDEQRGQQTGVPIKGRGTVMIDPAAANNAFTAPAARQAEVWKPSVFISYSKSNVNQWERLARELTVLKNAGLLAGSWYDLMSDAGDKWDPAIRHELGRADVVIILCSSAALATPYITEHEIPMALEQEAAGRTVVVPLILEACGWQSTKLSEFNALPAKGKPINECSPRSKGWHSVHQGLERLFRRLMEKGAVAVQSAPAARG